MTMPLPSLLNLIWRNLLVFLLLFFTQVRSEYHSTDPFEQVRYFTRWQEFDYITWTFEALFLKHKSVALDLPRYLTWEQQREVVLSYIELVRQSDRVRHEIHTIYADPTISDPQAAAQELLNLQTRLSQQIGQQGLLAEAVIQHQTSVIVGEIGLGIGRQPFPPPLFHISSLPLALIVSPRTIIRQDASVSLLPYLPLDEITRLEGEVEQGLDVSSLVVPVGGVGIYPTMVMSTTNLRWLAEVVAHEWIHNYFMLRPLGVLYLNSPELRIINETAASIAGKEIGDAVLARYYPEFLPPPEPDPEPGIVEEPLTPPDPPPFDFRAEMHETRVTVDALLEKGKVEPAEEYMEQRRQVFWDNGHRIRRLNQAYFAFYGAYADQPGGAAGEDPIGAAVRLLRAESPDLAIFINQISWVTSFEALQELLP